MNQISSRQPYGGFNSPLSPTSMDYMRRSSHLPTPETSTSGLELYEDDREEGVAENESRMYEQRLQPPAVVSAYQPYGSTKRSSSRRDSCNQGSPDHPPYRSVDSQRLSLPPLKAILAEGISSPPSTPIAHYRSFQPLAREPSYTSSTYKPPALYPHKKQRTDIFLNPELRIVRPSKGRPPSLIRTPIEQTAPTSDTPKSSFSASSVRLNPYLSGAPGHISTYDRAWSPTASQNEYQRVPRPSHTNCHCETQPELDRCREDCYARDSARSYGNYYIIRPDAQDDPALRPGYLGRDAGPQVGQSEVLGSPNSPDLLSGQYTGSQTALFIPGHADYHSRGSRKRSNLPKESTDIMKQWFDQNIGNPYPSEEQKAVFSNATGISMNQVSNWFINHRRRCPELRDKRERARGKDQEDQ